MFESNNIETTPIQGDLFSTIASEDGLAPGHHLDKLEIYNWGTFDKSIWRVRPGGKSSLLTGANGSGKSTIVDALLTLLVQNKKRNYNLSSGSVRRERTESTYVKGAYSNERSEFGTVKCKFIRDEKSYSVILATFVNQVTKDLITIGQFFWFEQKNLKKFYYTSHVELSIDRHFANFKTPNELRKNLRKVKSTEIYTTFSEYESYFVKHFGLRSSKALDLFNQVVAIKEIGHLNEFVRKHMLEEKNVSELLGELYNNYENLSLSHQAILLAKSQLDLLAPIESDAMAIKKLSGDSERVDLYRYQIPLYFTKKKRALLESSRDIYDSELTTLEERTLTIESNIKDLGKSREQLIVSINSDSIGQKIDGIKLLMEQQKEKIKERKINSSRYDKLASKLELKSVSNNTTFNSNLERGERLALSLNGDNEKKEEQFYQLRKRIDEIESKEREISKQLSIVKNSKGNLSPNFLAIRDKLASFLGVSISDLPFVAELITVSDSEARWKGAIEKLLYSFALRLLVPAHQYKKANKFLNNNNLGIKLVYHKVDLDEVRKIDISRISPDSIYFKLNYYRKSSYSAWVKEQIFEKYNYICALDVSDFQNYNKALTTSGLVKRGKTLHEKDDRKSGGVSGSGHTLSIYGRDSKDTVESFQKEFSKLRELKDKANKELSIVVKGHKNIENRLEACKELSNFKDFDQINWAFYSKQLEKLKNQVSALESKSSPLTKIGNELRDVEARIRTLNDGRDQLLSSAAVLKSKLQAIPLVFRELDEQEKRLGLAFKAYDSNNYSLEELENTLLDEKVIPKIKDITLDSLDKLKEEITSKFAKKREVILSKIEGLRGQLIRQMANFKAKFSDQSTELEVSMDYLDDYLKIADELKRDSLPEHERRFKNLLSKSVINDMAAFKSTLEIYFEEIKESVEQLNGPLKEINFSDATYVELGVSKSRDVEVREFQNLLKNAIKVVDGRGDKIDLEESFNRIKKILDKLKRDERLCKKVLDVRKWADFFVNELYRESGEQKRYYADSSGLSGGEKAKLAFTILASSLAYQYGLHREGASKSFRFVVVDEAFSKSDDKNSRYAMELFRELGLQLMVVTPNEKIYIVEPYIDKTFVTDISGDKNSSRVHSIKLSEFRNRVPLQ